MDAVSTLTSSILGDRVGKPGSWKTLDPCRWKCSEYNSLWQVLSQNHKSWREPWEQRSPQSHSLLSPCRSCASPGCVRSRFSASAWVTGGEEISQAGEGNIGAEAMIGGNGNSQRKSCISSSFYSFPSLFRQGFRF